MSGERITAYFTADEHDRALPLRVEGVGLSSNQRQINRPDGYEYYHLFRCVAGEGSMQAGGRSFTVGRDMVAILYPREPHRYAPISEPWLVDWITFEGGRLPELLAYLGFEHSMAFRLPAPELFTAGFREFAEILCGSKLGVKAALSSRLYRILVDLSRFLPADDSLRAAAYSRLEPVLRYIEAHIDRPFALAELAGEAGVSPQYLCLLFRQALNVRPFEYIHAHRINRAKRLLLEDRARPVGDIARACGFESVTYFNQVFKRLATLSPTGFRAIH